VEEDLINLWRGKGVKIRFPRVDRYRSVAKLLMDRGFLIEVKGNFWVAEFPTSFGIHRGHTDLTSKEFLEFYRDLEVLNGYKTKDEDYVIYVRPKRPVVVTFRVSESEYNIMKFAAEKVYKVEFSTWLRMDMIDRALKALSGEAKRRRRLRDLGFI